MQTLAKGQTQDSLKDFFGQNSPEQSVQLIKPTDELFGKVVGGAYKVLSILGEGGMGRLYEAERLEDGKRLALKVLHKSCSDRGDSLSRFEREAKALSQIRSPYVLELVDVLRLDDGRPCIVCEKLEGTDLEQWIEREKELPMEEAVSFIIQAAKGIAAAHELGIVHRDIKPSNLFLTKNAQGKSVVKVLDFGVAKLIDDTHDPMLTGNGIVGTPAYMPPEQARHSKQADVRADVYSLTAVLYRLVTGRCPYGNQDINATLIALLEGPPERPRKWNARLPPALELVIEKGMARHAADRPKDMHTLISMLTPFAAKTETDLDDVTVDIKPSVQRMDVHDTDSYRWNRGKLVGVLGLFLSAIALVTWCALGLLVTLVSERERLERTESILMMLGTGFVALLGLGGVAWMVRSAWKESIKVLQLRRKMMVTFTWFFVGHGIWTLLMQTVATWDKVPTSQSASLMLLGWMLSLILAASYFFWPRSKE